MLSSEGVADHWGHWNGRAAHHPLGLGAVWRKPVDIFPSIDIPVVSVVWTYNGMSAEEMQDRILIKHERQMASLVHDIGRIEANSYTGVYTGVGVIKVYLHEGADVSRAVSQLASCAQTVLKSMPRDITPPPLVRYDATNWRLTLIILASIPLSIKTAIFGICVGGQTLNTLTLGGSAFATAILVADTGGERLTPLPQQPDHQRGEGRCRVDVGDG